MALRALLVGAGNRGRFTYGGWARAHPDRLRIVALAEPVPDRRAAVAAEHELAADAVFEDWTALLAAGVPADVAIVATGDTLHVEPALAALGQGLHVLLEKPIAPSPVECLRVVEAAEKAGRMLQIGHVLRYTPFYGRIHEIVASGELGELVTVDMKEHVSYWHMAHSYVRGKFRNRRVAAPIVLAKTCHDLDLMAWFVGRPSKRVASFGSLRHFRAEAAPAGAPARCTEGCPAQADCLFDAERFYLVADDALARMWPWADLGLDATRAARRRALETGPYGVCIYRCDNDVPDRQVMAIEFEGGITATFTLHGLASHERRTIRLTGTRGELRGVFQDGVIEVSRHGALEPRRESVPSPVLGHGGGDDGLMDHFTDVVRRDAAGEVRASGRVSLDSHLLGFAAEEAREAARVVDMADYRAAVAAEAARA